MCCITLSFLFKIILRKNFPLFLKTSNSDSRIFLLPVVHSLLMDVTKSSMDVSEVLGWLCQEQKFIFQNCSDVCVLLMQRRRSITKFWRKAKFKLMVWHLRWQWSETHLCNEYFAFINSKNWINYACKMYGKSTDKLYSNIWIAHTHLVLEWEWELV